MAYLVQVTTSVTRWGVEMKRYGSVRRGLAPRQFGLLILGVFLLALIVGLTVGALGVDKRIALVISGVLVALLVLALIPRMPQRRRE